MLNCEGGCRSVSTPKARYATVKMRVPAGAVLVLTTDGLLETDGDDVDYNVRCLLGALEHGTKTDLETLADDLLNSPRRPPRHGDDVALLLARLNEHAPPVWSRRLRAISD